LGKALKFPQYRAELYTRKGIRHDICKLKNKEESIPIQDVLRIVKYKIGVVSFRDSSAMPARNCETTSEKDFKNKLVFISGKLFLDQDYLDFVTLIGQSNMLGLGL